MLFTPAQLETLRAALDRIIPADDFPGAWDAGVGDYLFGQLDGDLCHLLPLYRDGLTALDTEATARFGAPLAALSAEQQDELLHDVEIGRVKAPWPISPTAFFTHLVNHAAEGYYSDPGNGGNRNARSWEMIGYQPRGQFRQAGEKF